MLKIIQKYSFTLATFAAVFTGLTAVVDMLTKSNINKQIEWQKKKLFDQVIPVEMYDNNLQESCFLVQTPMLGKGEHHVYIARKENKLVGAIMEATAPDGYSGVIRLLVGSDFSGTVLGTRIIEQHETPGLGDKIEIHVSDWILNFAGKIVHGVNDYQFAVKKDGGRFDQFTGATITPRAVVNAVKRAVLYAQTLPGQMSTLSSCKKK